MLINPTPTQFREVPNDPLKVQHYTLANGLQVFMSVNHDAPRVYTNIAFRVGSKYDPADTTGLAHYMEHMLFKGTSQIGALDWEKESALLDKIASLFETYRQTEEDDKRADIYRQIDQLSYEAAQLVAPNEYDRLTAAIGAKGTNAYTWVEQTVYVNDIPSNELERWVKLERERFRYLALRLFHTELETVYEEYNMSQAKDFRKVHQALRSHLFPNHPYGTQTTLGNPEHLKNPSMRNIERFFNTYYVPNNAAICLAGDFDPAEAIAAIERYFGDWESVDFPAFSHKEQPSIEAPVKAEVLGQESAYVQIGWRTTGGKYADYMLGLVVRQILYNEQAGLIDLNLNQQQVVLEASAYNWVYEDYSTFGLYGKAREGQSLEDVEQHLLQQVERLRRGDFPDWLLEAAINDMRLGDLKATEKNQSRVGVLTTCFILGIPYDQFVNRYERLDKLTKADIVEYAQTMLRADAYVTIYKREGEDPAIVKVEKPTITPVPLQREATSNFAASFLTGAPDRLVPVFADFDKSIQRTTWQKGLQFDYVHNPNNPLFQLTYIFEMGKNHSQVLPLAMIYLPYLSTSKYTAAQIQQRFFQLGLHFEVSNDNNRAYVTLSGLESSLEEGIKLVEHILADVQPDSVAWQAVVADVLTRRENLKQNKDAVMRSALSSYAQYGPSSPFTYRVPAADLQAMSADEPIRWIHQLHQYEHRVYYFGQHSAAEAERVIRPLHRVANHLLVPLEGARFPQLATDEPAVLFAHFPMVQNEVMLLSRGTPHFNLHEHIKREVYNEYFGYGLSSIVFQEIREAKALAYSTYAYYTSPAKADRAHYLKAYVATQPDKVADALPTLLQLLEKMPLIPDNIERSRQALLQKIESDRIAPRQLYGEAQTVWDVGYQHDILHDAYEHLQEMKAVDLGQFHSDYVKGRSYKILVMGDRSNTPLDYLAQFGSVTELNQEQLFGY